MLTFYSVEQNIKVHDGKQWLALEAQDLQGCLLPMESDESELVDSHIYFENKEDAKTVALDGVNVAPKGTHYTKKVAQTDQEQYPIFTWQFTGDNNFITDEAFDLNDGSTIDAKRIPLDQNLTLVSASLSHVNANRFKDVLFNEDTKPYAPVEKEQAQPLVQPQAPEQQANSPQVLVVSASSSWWNNVKSAASTLNRSSVRWSFGATIASYAIDTFMPDLLPSAMMVGLTTLGVIEGGVQLKHAIDKCRKPKQPKALLTDQNNVLKDLTKQLKDNTPPMLPDVGISHSTPLLLSVNKATQKQKNQKEVAVSQKKDTKTKATKKVASK